MNWLFGVLIGKFVPLRQGFEGSVSKLKSGEDLVEKVGLGFNRINQFLIRHNNCAELFLPGSVIKSFTGETKD